MSKLSNRKFKIIYAGLLMLMIFIASPSIVHASGNELPDRNMFGAAAGTVALEIAQEGSYISLDANESWAKFYFDTTSGKPDIGVSMFSPQFKCDPGGGGPYDRVDAQGNNLVCVDPVDGAGNGSVDYNFFYGDPSACATPPATGCGIAPKPASFFRVNSAQSVANPDAWNSVFQTPANGVPEAPIPTGIGTETRVIVYVQAIWRTDHPSNPEGRINSFTIGSTSNGTASYWASGVGYAVQNRIRQMPGEDSFFNFEFAPQCNEPPSKTAMLKWKDADASGNSGVPPDGASFGGDNEIYFDLFEGDQGGGGWTLLTTVTSGGATNGYSIAGGNIGGNGADRSMQFTARNTKIYSWKWYNVNWDNGVQMTLPYDSYYGQKTCTPPAADHGVEGRVFNDINGNGMFEPGSGEYLIKTPGATCSGQHTDADATVTADGKTGNLTLCNGPGFGPPFDSTKTYSLFRIRTTACGTVPVTVNPPPGWVVTVGKGATRNFTVPCGTSVPYATYSGNVDDYFGIRRGQGVQGRVFIDDNNNGRFDAGLDQIIKNPTPGPCDGPNIFVGGVSVTALSNGNNSLLDKCNGPFPSPPGFSGPGSYALWQVSTPPGSQTVQVTVPTDWVINKNLQGATRTYNVPAGGYGGPASVDDYFGMLPRHPDVTPICVNSNSLAQISWPTAGFSGTGYYVDISTAPNFSSYSNKYIGSGGARSISDAPNGFVGSLASGNVKFTENGTYYARIFYVSPNVHSDVYQFTADKCPKLVCGTMTPTDVESLDTGTDIRVSFRNVGQGDLNTTAAILRVNYPGYPATATAYSPSPAPLTSGNTATSNSGAIPFTKSGGKYTIKWTVTGDPRSNSLNGAIDPLTGRPECEADLTVSDKPYFKAYGSDVVVGITQPPPATPCPGWSSVAGSNLLGFSNSVSVGAGAGKGAGAQLAAFALGTIDGFVTTAGQTYSAPPGSSGTGLLPKGLSFANTTAGYGGGSGLPWCPPDYFNAAATATPATAAFWLNLTAPLTGIPNGSTYFDGASQGFLGQPVNLSNATLQGTYIPFLGLGQPPLDSGSTLPARPPRKVAVYVKGDVVINGDITYDTNNWSVGKIPSLYVIVKGNIYIQPGVKQIDGVYIAQESSTGVGGIIYTCANGAAPPPNQAWLINNCYTAPPSGASPKKLIVNGSLIAQHLRLLRLVGTRFLGSTQELSNSNNIAEMVTSGPETWLTIPAPYPPSPIGGYDAATSLPPTL